MHIAKACLFDSFCISRAAGHVSGPLGSTCRAVPAGQYLQGSTCRAVPAGQYLQGSSCSNLG